ncbi:MAG: hypothetical protein LBI17_00315 [Rickettsiales bacterium]|jgi:hypothetical protein|nr:hypothetical protein [Rickettsiales bacterium]
MNNLNKPGFRLVRGDDPETMTSKEIFLNALDILNGAFTSLHKTGVLEHVGVGLFGRIRMFDENDEPTPVAEELMHALFAVLEETADFARGMSDPRRWGGVRNQEDHDFIKGDEYRRQRLAYDVDRLGIISMHSDSFTGPSRDVTPLDLYAWRSVLENGMVDEPGLPTVDADELDSPALKKAMDARREAEVMRLKQERREKIWAREDEERKKKNEELDRQMDGLLSKFIWTFEGNYKLKHPVVESETEADNMPEAPDNPVSHLDADEQIMQSLKEINYEPRRSIFGRKLKPKLEPVAERNAKREAEAVYIHDILRRKYNYTGPLGLSHNDNAKNVSSMKSLQRQLQKEMLYKLKYNPCLKLATEDFSR